MSWNTNNRTKTVYSKMNGQTQAHDFDAVTKLREVVKSVASARGLGAVIVKADGREVQSDEGDKEISAFGNVEILPKMAGASDEDASPSETEEDDKESR